MDKAGTEEYLDFVFMFHENFRLDFYIDVNNNNNKKSNQVIKCFRLTWSLLLNFDWQLSHKLQRQLNNFL